MIDMKAVAQEMAESALLGITYTDVVDALPSYLSDVEAETIADQVIEHLDNANVVIEEV